MPIVTRCWAQLSAPINVEPARYKSCNFWHAHIANRFALLPKIFLYFNVNRYPDVKGLYRSRNHYFEPCALEKNLYHLFDPHLTPNRPRETPHT